ncbi:MAG: septum formation initiator family protein [Flavobacteriales bacterium]|nr:septum formation initiator family protein [Flavobacteriales bacterium]MBL6873308.1 septum formation initiator family protein [Flavobacteriales bacterium]
MLKEYYDKLPPILKNKFVLVTLALLIWMAFFDSNNWIKQARLQSEIDDLEEQKEYYLKEIEKDSIALFDLTNNTETQEKFAREKYLMKKENEDIIVIIKDDE